MVRTGSWAYFAMTVAGGTRWSAEAWPQVKAEFTKALALRSQIRRAGRFN